MNFSLITPVRPQLTQHDAADIALTHTGNDEEDDDHDHEIASIERVVTDSSECTKDKCKLLRYYSSYQRRFRNTS